LDIYEKNGIIFFFIFIFSTLLDKVVTRGTPERFPALPEKIPRFNGSDPLVGG
jgi:hypothetical protein